MGSFSIWHWVVVLLVVLLLFGSGKISGLMGDLATGIKSFKKNMREDEPDASMADTRPVPPAGTLPPATTTTAAAPGAADPRRTVVSQPPGPAA
ncbi:twin-arginine translocase TatA/TatE family subunit [Muricoccus radiodurans]|uniref:twin-arginine translocase TatA/TatE family subunit n=1 Tax=Muricoccus radiodurans TaxID=2231721 RepID=UPI003CF05C8C